MYKPEGVLTLVHRFMSQQMVLKRGLIFTNKKALVTLEQNFIRGVTSHNILFHHILRLGHLFMVFDDVNHKLKFGGGHEEADRTTEYLRPASIVPMTWFWFVVLTA